MTKQKTIYLWGFLLLFLGIINSCRQEFLQEQQQQYNAKNELLNFKIIKLSQSKHKKTLNSKLSESKKILSNKIQNNASGKFGNFEDISIDTENVIYIENGDYHTYTFKIERSNPQPNDPLENLILSNNEDGSYKMLINSYLLSEEDLIDLKQGKNVDYRGKVTVTELSDDYSIVNRGGCSWGTATFIWPCTCSPAHTDASICDCGTKPHTLVVDYFTCGGFEELPYVIQPIETPGPPSGGGVCTDCPENPIPTNCVSIPTSSQDPNAIINDNGCAIGTPTFPNLGENNEPKTDCERLYEKTNDVDFKKKLDSITTLVTQPNPDQHETAFVAKKSQGTITYTITSGASNTTPSADGTIRTEIEFSNLDVASGHNHAAPDIPIFSFVDIVTLYEHYKFLHPIRKNEFSMFNANHNGTIYAFRLQDLAALDTLFDGLDLDTKEGRKEAEEKVKNIYKIDGDMNVKLDYTSEMAEKMLMRVLNSSKIGAGSIFLYQYEDNVWKKLNLKSNGEVQKTPCP